MMVLAMPMMMAVVAMLNTAMLYTGMVSMVTPVVYVSIFVFGHIDTKSFADTVCRSRYLPAAMRRSSFLWAAGLRFYWRFL
jgi:hypothetical protein